jgi:hypothetical protein
MIPAAQVVEIRRLFFAEHWRVGTIATQCGLHPDTVRLAIETDRFARPAALRPSLCDPYRAFLQATLQQYPRLRATRLFELVAQLVGGELAALAVQDEVVGAVPGLDHLQPLVDLPPERLQAQVIAQERGFQRLP